MPVIFPPGLARGCSKPGGDHILGHNNEWNGLGFLLKLLRNEIARDHDCIRCCLDDRRHDRGGLLVIETEPAGYEFEVFAFDKTLLAQFIKKGRRRRLVPPGTDHDSEAIDAAWLLRTRAEWQRYCRSADKTDEFTPFHCHPRPSRRYRSNLGRH
jgi:hypothetical protein